MTESTVFVELIQGIDVGHPAILITAYVVFLAWHHGKWPFHKRNGNGIKAASAVQSNLDSHEKHCEERHARIHQTFAEIREDIAEVKSDVGEVKTELAHVAGILEGERRAR